MLEWQPIETAPKDGTDLVLAMYCERSLEWLTKGRWTQTSSWYANGYAGGEIVTFWHDSGGVPLHQPTHWMPLPAPPQQPSGGDDGRD